MTVLTSTDKDDLAPHYDAIRLYRSAGCEVSVAPRQTMAKIYQQKTGEIVNFSCGSCIGELYDIINIYLDDYESGGS